VPVAKAIGITTAQTTTAVTHAIRTAMRPFNLTSEVPFTMRRGASVPQAEVWRDTA
jgi:hypothetical protein